jgi:hypothetical protein
VSLDPFRAERLPGHCFNRLIAEWFIQIQALIKRESGLAGADQNAFINQGQLNVLVLAEVSGAGDRGWQADAETVPPAAEGLPGSGVRH